MAQYGVLHPCLLWAQRNDILLLTINLTDIKHEKLSLNENKLTFEGVGGPEERQYACELEFMEQIVPQGSKCSKTSRGIYIVIKKKTPGPYWSRLIRDSTKNYNIQTDLNNWMDEDECDVNAKNPHDDNHLNEVFRDLQMGKSESTCVICAQALIDPVTLNCGHSFCQLCLANMWSNKCRPHPLQLKCPACQQPWKILPAINIQLRNITECSYPSIVKSRRAAMTEADLKLIQEFTASQRNQLQSFEIMGVLSIGFVIVIVLMVLVFCLVLWVSAGAGAKFMRKPVGMWSNEDVLEWVEGLGEWTQPNYTDIFRKEKITGPHLLMLSEKALEAIGVQSEYRRQTILQAIEELKFKEYSAPRNLYEFKAAHRKQTHLVTAFYIDFNRLAFVYTYLFCYYEIFLPFLQFHIPSTQDKRELDEQEIWLNETEKIYDAEVLTEKPEPTLRQLFAFALEVLLIPHFLVAGCAWNWFGHHPWICSAIMIHCCWATVQEGRATVTLLSSGSVRTKIPYICWAAMKKTFLFVLVSFIFTLAWHIIPHFICDFLFYFYIWLPLIKIVALCVLKISGRQINAL